MSPQSTSETLHPFEVHVVTVDAYRGTFYAATEEEARALGRNFFECDQLDFFDHAIGQIEHVVVEPSRPNTGGAR